MERLACLFLTTFLLVGSSLSDDPLGSPESYLKYDVKKGASLDPNYEAVGYWNGSVLGWTRTSQGIQYQKLFLFEGVNLRSVQPQVDGTYLSLSREVSIYRDFKTGDILQAWSSIYTGVSNEVFEVANDPVNAVLHPYVGQHSSSLHHTSFTGDFWLDYPNPLPPDEYPAFSSGPQYQGGELFLTFARTENLLNPELSEVGYVGSWSRVGPFLPWMEMGSEEGGLVYSAPFVKLSDVDQLPSQLLGWIIENYPDYLHPPRNYTVPNMTSWRVFKSIIDQRRAAGQPDIQVPDQPPWSSEKPNSLDKAFLEELASLGTLELEFEGTTYFLEEGSTGQELVWMEGSLQVQFYADFNHLDISMLGSFATPWPDQRPLSGSSFWVDGVEVEVPWINSGFTIDVDPEECSTMAVASDGWNYSVLSCEVVLAPGDHLFLLTLYLGKGPAGQVEVVGGVTTKKAQVPSWMSSWLGKEGGSLVERWLLKAPPAN